LCVYSSAEARVRKVLYTTKRLELTLSFSPPLPCRNLVIGVREMLAKTGFTQNPCLECSGKWADAAFVVEDK
jgi:hypothetical protein